MNNRDRLFFSTRHGTVRGITALPVTGGRIVFGALCLFLATAATGDSDTQRLVLAGATLIDATGAAPAQNARIVIEGGQFVCISGPDGCPSSPNDRVIDVTGTWITPGLIDTHVHLQAEADPETMATDQALRFALGITTVRDAGTGQLEPLLDERKRAAEADRAVPRIVVSARPLVTYSQRYGVQMGSELVRHLASLGVDAIKIKDNTDTDLWEQEVRTASELGIPVWGHVYDSIGPPPRAITRPAIAAGLNGISHLSWIAPFCQKPGFEVTPRPDKMEVHEWRKSYWLTTDTACVDALIDDVVRAGVWLEPTLVTEWYWWGRDLKPPHTLAFLRKEPPGLLDILTGHEALDEPTEATFTSFFPLMSDFVRRFHEAGGMLITGGDELRPGLDIHAEIKFFREAGLSPMESLQAATRNAAIALGRDDLGTIEVGKLADAVIYTSDPLDPDGTSLNVKSVIKGGAIYASDALLDQFRERYRKTVRGLWFKRALWFAGICIALFITVQVGVRVLHRRSRSA